MNKRKEMGRPALGGSMLLVIFGVLCLTVFSLLSLHTVLAERRLSQAAARSVQDWYEADLRAQEIFSRLRRGEIPEDVEHAGGEYRYTVAISHHQTLEVTLKENDGCWEILSWQTVAHPEDGNTLLPVWQEGTQPEGES